MRPPAESEKVQPVQDPLDAIARASKFCDRSFRNLRRINSVPAQILIVHSSKEKHLGLVQLNDVAGSGIEVRDF